MPIMNMKFNILDRLSDILHTLNGYFNSEAEFPKESEFARNWLVTSGFLFVGLLISNLFLYIVNNTGLFGAIFFLGTSWYLT